LASSENCTTGASATMKGLDGIVDLSDIVCVCECGEAEHRRRRGGVERV
jgi:hypothetical protein